MAPNLMEEGSLAVVSPYKAQVANIRSRLAAALGAGAQLIDVNTIDGFQARGFPGFCGFLWVFVSPKTAASSHTARPSPER